MRGSVIAATLILLLAACSNQTAQFDETGEASPTAEPSVTASPTRTQPTVTFTQSPGPTASPTASPTDAPPADQGQYGDIHSMTADDAFPDGADTCENVGQRLASGERSDVGYRLSFPQDWYTNPETAQYPACALFHPEPFDPDDVASAAIRFDMPPGGEMTVGPDSTPLEEVDATIEEYTVDDVPALRVEFEGEPSLLWIVGIGGSLPDVGNDRPYIAVSLRPSDPDDLPGFSDVLDRMIATLEVIDS